MTEKSDNLQLGGNIELSGFNRVDPASMIIVKKIVGNYSKKFSEQNENFEKLKLNMKEVHKTPKSEKYEMHCTTVIKGKNINAEVTERNIFVAMDSVLKKISNKINK